MKKKTFIILLLFLILIGGCLQMYQSKSSIENANLYALNNSEVLISIHTKIIKYGTVSFLEYINSGKIKQTNYSYYINIDSNKAVFRKYEEKVFFLEHINDRIDISGYFTTNQFNKQYRNYQTEKYYKCISDNFLEITNVDRKYLLDSLSK